MKRFLMVAAAVIIGVIISQVFFNKSEPEIDSVSTQISEQEETAEQAASPVSIPAELISKAPQNARVFIIEPIDGASVSSPIVVKFGIENMTVVKAGDNTENSGHHHLLIDLNELPDLSAPLPATEQLIHFGGAQTETTIELAPGEHTLQLLLGNYLHIPHDQPVMSDKITISVE